MMKSKDVNKPLNESVVAIFELARMVRWLVGYITHRDGLAPDQVVQKFMAAAPQLFTARIMTRLFTSLPAARAAGPKPQRPRLDAEKERSPV